MTKEELDRLEELALNATAGPWSIEEHGLDGLTNVLYAGRSNERHGLNLLYITDPDWNWANNSAYLENADPNTILRLITRIRELETLNSELVADAKID